MTRIWRIFADFLFLQTTKVCLKLKIKNKQIRENSLNPRHPRSNLSNRRLKLIISFIKILQHIR